MVELAHRLNEPVALRALRTRDPQAPWDSLPQMPEKRDIRHQLNAEQEGLCIYCEDALDPDSGHIEHIVPRSRDRSLTFVYTNLAHSCQNRDQCGASKSGQLLPIEPRPGCSAYFELSITTGRLAPSRRETLPDQSRAETALAVLGLNRNPGLVRRRQLLARTVVTLDQQSSADAETLIASLPFRWSLRGLVT